MVEVVVDATGCRPTMEEGRRVAEALLDQTGEMPTAIFAHNDLMAMGALATLRDAGLDVPEDVSLAGYNDLAMMDLVAPPLTTVRYPSREIGLMAGEVAIRLLGGEEVADINLDPRLVIRESTRPTAGSPA